MKAIHYAVCAIALTWPAVAFGQDSAATNPQVTTRTFAPADFAQFAPKTALDMVLQIPGFSISDAEEKRGLGQGGGNILINSQRFSGKSNDARAELGRISAANVIRIELIDGATLNIPGLVGQVVNVVTNVGGVTGQFRWNPDIRFRQTAPSLYDGEISVSGKSGKFDYTLSVSNDSYRNGNNGPERVLDGNGAITDRRNEVLTVYGDRTRAAIGAKYAGGGGDIGNLNLSFENFDNEIAEQSDGVVVRDRDYFETEKEYNYEIGGDYQFRLGRGQLKLIGLRRFEHSPFFVRVLFDFEDGRPDEGIMQNRTVDESETIARAEYSWKAGRADWQISAEAALNSLDNTARLAELDAGGEFIPVPLPGADTEVKETRGEIAISYGRPLSASLTLQTSLGGEVSRITQSGAAGLSRQFFRPKGFIALAWKPSPRLDLSFRVEREVGQLDFFDFVASADIGAGNANAGNPNLVPQQSWNVEFEATRNLGGFGSFNAKAFVQFVTDIVDQIPVGDDSETPGNIASARIWGVSVDSTITLDPLGLAGAKIDLDYSYRKSRVADPLTGIHRRLSEDLIHEFEIEFRHDIAKTNWAYGANYNDFSQADNVRLGEVTRFPVRPGGLGLFIENKNVFGLTVRGGIYNLLGTNEALSRTVYVNRRDGPIRFTENRDRTFGPILSFNVSGTF